MSTLSTSEDIKQFVSARGPGKKSFSSRGSLFFLPWETKKTGKNGK
jgi:hypothetical protein